MTPHLILAALFGAIAWNLFTWYLGLPSSSSHALVGGLVGAALAAGGPDPVQWDGIWNKVVWPGLASPVIGLRPRRGAHGGDPVGSSGASSRGRSTARSGSRRSVSGSFMAFAHGTNDAQKTMGVIALALYSAGHTSSPTDIPTWVIAVAATAIAAGTYVGGWRIMRTMGTRIFKLEPPQGFAAQATASGVLYTVATRYGFPVSTTHVISSSVMGAGATTRVSAVRWGVAADIVTAWLLTIPAAGLVAAGMYELLARSCDLHLHYRVRGMRAGMPTA